MDSLTRQQRRKQSRKKQKRISKQTMGKFIELKEMRATMKKPPKLRPMPTRQERRKILFDRSKNEP